MILKTNELKDFILLEQKRITIKNTQSIIKNAKTKTERGKILKLQRSVTTNTLNMYDKRTDIINAFVNNIETNVELHVQTIRIKGRISRKHSRKNKNRTSRII